MCGGGAFEKVISNIKCTKDYIDKKKRKVNLSVSCVETKKTQNQHEIISDKLKDVIDEIVVFQAKDLEYLNDVVKKEYGLYEEKNNKEKRCCAPLFNTMYIDSVGNVNLCCRNNNTKIVMGIIDDKLDLKGIWHGKKYTGYRKRMLKNELKKTVCDNCYLRELK